VIELSANNRYLPMREPARWMSIDPASRGGSPMIDLSSQDRAGSSFGRTLDSLRDSQRSFMAATGRVQYDHSADEEVNARRSAEQFVAGTLILPMLKQLRDSATAAPPPFGPSEGEKKFHALADAKLADSIVSAKGFPLVDRLTDTLLRRGIPERPVAMSTSLSTATSPRTEAIDATV